MLNDMGIMGYSFVAEHSPGMEPCNEHSKKENDFLKYKNSLVRIPITPKAALDSQNPGSSFTQENQTQS